MTFSKIGALPHRRNQIRRHLDLALKGCDGIGLSTAACHIAMALEAISEPSQILESADFSDCCSDEILAAAAFLVEARNKLSDASSELFRCAANPSATRNHAMDLLVAAVDCERAAIEFGLARGRVFRICVADTQAEPLYCGI
jgi:hypothetical protein